MTQSQAFERYRPDGGESPPLPQSTRRERGRYIASPELAAAVNTALACEQPLLVTGEPGTGKTTLAQSVADQLGLGAALEFHTRSDHQAKDVLYVFDSLRRFYDAQVRDPAAKHPGHYLSFQALGAAIRSETQRVVLIDEIDKAPRDLPNDLLNVIDRMEFEVVETGESFRSAHRPIVIITSNVERQLPDPFLRRCVFHHIDFPDAATLEQILIERLGPDDRLESVAGAAVRRFVELRERFGSELSKQPATGELLAWVKVLLRAGHGAGLLEDRNTVLPHLGALIKGEEDLRHVLGR